MRTQNRAIPELSIDTQTIERMLQTIPVGGIATYEMLSQAIGRDVQHEARHNLQTARDRLLRSDRMVFEAVLDVGVKRLDDEGKIATGKKHLRSSRNHAYKAMRKTSAVDDFANLPNNLKIEHNTVRAIAGALRQMTSTHTQKKIEGAIGQDERKKLGLKDCLTAMKATI